MPLFTFKTNEQQAAPGADLIEPSKNQHVNVVTDYAWTINPKSARQDVPYIFLIERKITNNVMIQQILYNLAAAFEVGQEAVADVEKILSSKNISEKKKTELKDKLDKNQSNIDKQLGEKRSMFSADEPYMGLYDLEDTGWSYVLPYFDKKNHDIKGEWGEPGAEGGSFVDKIGAAASTALGGVAGGVNQITSLLGVLSGNTGAGAKVGTYIEKAKQYSFTSGGPSYSVEFNLYNTGKLSDVIDNWELCFALMYNLLPNRRTKTVFDPPPLYEVHIPGVRRSPVSFISGMQVSFLGATRLMDLDVGGGDNPLRTIVPDAYSVKINIEDVLPESKNFMQSTIDETKLVRVSRVEKVERSSNGSIKPGGGVDKTIKTETVPRTLAQKKISENNGITRISL